MSNRKKYAYIISNYKFHKHWNLDRAKQEKLRLEGIFPQETFRIYWVRAKINKFGDKCNLLPPEPKPNNTITTGQGKPILKLKKPKKANV